MTATLTQTAPQAVLDGNIAALIAAGASDLAIDTHILASTRYIQRGAPDDHNVDLATTSIASGLYGKPLVRLGGRHRQAAQQALLEISQVEVNDRDVVHRSCLYSHERGTAQLTLTDWHARRLQQGDWIAVDPHPLDRLRGLARTLWLLLSAPRPFAFTPTEDGRESLAAPLDPDAYRALAITAPRARDRKRNLKLAAQYVLSTDDRYVEFAITPDPTQTDGDLFTVTRRRVDAS